MLKVHFPIQNKQQKPQHAPHTIFLRVKNPRFFDSHCIIGHVSAVPEDNQCWKQLELSNSIGKGSGKPLWLGLDLVFQFISDVGHCADTYTGGTDTCLVTSPVCLLSQWGWVRGLPGFVYLWVLKKIKRRDGTDALPIMYFWVFLLKTFLKKEKKSFKKDYNMANLLHKITFCV